jgi:hypothetical protein
MNIQVRCRGWEVCSIMNRNHVRFASFSAVGRQNEAVTVCVGFGGQG